MYFFALLCYGQAGKKSVSLLFAGDAMQHKSQLDAAKTKEGYDYSKYFAQIKNQIDSVDLSIVNFETTLPGKNYTGYPTFGSPDEFAFALKEAGFNIFLTANNHCLDKRKKGLERTIQVLDSIGIKHLGTYVNQDRKDLLYPMIVVKNGIRIGLLNYTYGTNGIEVQSPNIVNYINKESILADIDILKKMQPDIMIANMHWGEEYKLKPNNAQKDLAAFLRKNGIKLIIGSHPHVVQPIEINKVNDSIKDVTVYSLGNFISGMKAINTDGGMMVRINISKEPDKEVQIDDCTYSLVWVYKPLVNGQPQFQLLPVDEYENEEGKDRIGEVNYLRMTNFATTARTVIESLWTKAENDIEVKPATSSKNN